MSGEGKKFWGGYLTEQVTNKIISDFSKVEKSPMLLGWRGSSESDEVMIGEIASLRKKENMEAQQVAIKKEDATLRVIEKLDLYSQFNPVEIITLKKKEGHEDTKEISKP